MTVPFIQLGWMEQSYVYVPGAVSVTVNVWPALIVIGESGALPPEGCVSQWTLCGAPDWLSWSTQVIVLFTPTTTVIEEGWKFSDWSAPTFWGMITVTPLPLDELDPELDPELDTEPLVDELVPIMVPLVLLELDPEEVIEVVVEFDEIRLEFDDEMTPVLLLLLLTPLLLLLLLLHVDRGMVNELADEELSDEDTMVELVVLLSNVVLLVVGAMLVDVVMPVLVKDVDDDELDAVEVVVEVVVDVVVDVVVVVTVELAWAGEGLRPATAPLPDEDELPLVLDSVPMPDEDRDVLLVELVLFVALVEKPELVEELELITRDELLVGSDSDEEVVHVVFEVVMLEIPEVEVIGRVAELDELVGPMPLVLLELEVDGVDGARVARYTAMPAIMIMTIIIAAPAVVEMALDS